MKKICLLSTLVLTVLLGKVSLAQDFSNKGKDFWVAYGYHQVMLAGNSQEMVLYFAADQNTNVTVSIPGVGYTQSYFVAANTVLTSNPIPKAGAQDVRLTTEIDRPEDKGIHITADKPIVAYAHIYNASVSGATILFPTATLGKEYYSINYKNVSNSANANCWFYVLACDTGITNVEITPSANTLNHAAGIPFTVSLQQGQVYNIMGQLTSNVNPYTSVDLTGSKIQSISTSNGSCKRIAVFSGSGRISLTCNSSSSSSDNYMVQSFPKTAWGKKFLTAPTGGSSPNNIFRICVSNPATPVTLNGGPIGVPLTNNFYYELPVTSSPMRIESNDPITVAQYLTSQGACGNGSPGDPEVIYLSPVEQNINKVLWNATSNFSITQHYYNVIIPSGGTALSSFKQDGVSVSPSLFTPHPQAPGYSYYTGFVFGGQHTISSDSGFNAIAYGYGNAESYGYNAGTNIKDIYQYISVENQYATVNFPATCKNTPFYFSMTFPYQPTQIQWIFNGLFPNVTVNNPVPFSTIVVNGRTLYQYRLPTPYSIPTPGTYPIKVIAQNPTPDGCGGEQEIDYDLQVFEQPTADFNFTTNGCVTNPVQFTDNNSNGSGRPIVNWHWNFGDNTTSAANNPTHIFPAPGSYTVKYAIRTDVGCISDTVSKIVTLSDLPVAKFGFRAPQCVGKQVTFSDTSSVTGGLTLVKWTWNFGDGSPVVVATTNADQTHTYTTAGTYNVTLVVETNSGCVSNVFTRPVTISPNPTAAFALPNICLPSGSAQFTDQSTGGPISSYAWDFGDGNTSTQQNPVHYYTGTGPYTATLTVTASTGCTDDSVRTITNIFAQPHADFTVDSLESCMGGTVNFTDASTATNSTVTQWFWDFGDATTSNVQHPNKQYATPGTYTVKLWINSAAGCRSDTMTKTITVLQLPTVSFTNSTPLCEAGSILFTSTSTPNAGAFTQYTWTVNSATTGGNAPTLTYTPASAGSYTVQLTAVTDKGCSNVSSSTITVNAKPVANFTLPNVCLPAGTASFTSTSTVSNGTITGYSWTFGDGNTSTLQNPTNTYTGTGPYNVSLTVTSNSGCTDTKTQALTTIYAEPQAAFNAPAEVCLGTVANFTDISTAPGSTVSQWSWNFGDGNTSTVKNPSHTYAAAGTYTVTLSVTSAIGCQTINNIATRTVVVNALPTADFTIGLPGCVTRTITFTDASAPNAGTITKWNWNFGDGNTAALTTPGASHVYNTAGTYNVTLQIESSKGCISTVTTKPIEINVLPKAGFIVPEACISDVAALFTDTSRVVPGSITAWSWNFGDANANAGNPNTSTAQNPTHQFTAPGSYTTSLIAYSDKGCTDTARNTFFVNGSVPVANFTVENTTPLCSNKSVSIKDASTVDVGSLVKLEVYWDYANDPTIKTTDDNPANGKIYTHTYPEFSTPASRTVTIRYVAYSGETCLNTFTRTITLLATPALVFSNVTPVCEDAPSFQLTQAQITNGLPGTGVFTGTGISPTGLFNPATAGSGQHTITYTFTGTNGCINTISNVVEVNPKPGINAGPDKFILEGGSAMLTPSSNANVPVTYLWSPPTGLSNPAIANPIASPADDITYTLKVTSDKGCVTTDDVFVKVLKAPIIPNVFTPNGDGRNDKWVIEYLESYPGCIVEVYNRYGQVIFRSIGYTRPWDGTYNGKEAPAGTYYYIVDPKNGRKRMAGFVDIVR